MELTTKQQKALALFESIICTATAITNAMKEYPKYKLPRIAKAGRRRRALVLLKTCIATEIGRSQALMILSQPTPKYPPGCAIKPDNLAIIGDNRPEVLELSTYPGKLLIPRLSLPKLEP